MKEKIPTYSICNLLGANQCATDILVADLQTFLTENRCLVFPHRHSFYQIVGFTKGGGTHNIDFQRFMAEEGQVYHMTLGQVHTWDFTEETEGFIINFSESFFASVCHNPHYLADFPMFKSIGNSPVTQFIEAERANIFSIFAKLLTEFEGDAPFRQDILRAKLMELMVLIARKNMPKNIEKNTKHHITTLHQFERLIELNFIEKRLPKDYAEMLFVTPNHLNALVSATTGKSAGELIRDRVLLEAKRMLVNSDQNINEIAYQLDFEDNAYFSRFFKKYTSVTPDEFRKNYFVN